tara:strand:+ start:130 stop:249 length:120 start_codon:yes stop_codon:yes gene_type:complete
MASYSQVHANYNYDVALTQNSFGNGLPASHARGLRKKTL